ncbi:MAG: hypothetical protein KME16_17235 [Scytolyngbya sp. HA4215-MV1]|nr:hypothetical protein [Scytolyngbya sp. HA4215-MV1]
MTKSTENSNSLSVLPYQVLQAQIKPGDVIAFSGIDIPSTVVKVATRSEYVHVAIVLSVGSIAQSEDSILIAESHVDTRLPSVGIGKPILGAQLQWLSRRMAASPGPAWWVALKTPLDSTRMRQMQTWLYKVEQEQTPYDFLQAIEAGIDSLTAIGLESPADDSALFCSELVTRALQIAGVLDENINPAQQTPAELMQFSCFESPILIKT